MPSATFRSTRSLAIVAAIAIVLATLAVGLVAAPPADAAQPAPGHTGLVPRRPGPTPRGSATARSGTSRSSATASSSPARSPRCRTPPATPRLVNQRVPGVVQPTRPAWSTPPSDPTFGGGGVDAVEASPDGTKLYVAGTFSTVNGVTKRKIASHQPDHRRPGRRLHRQRRRPGHRARRHQHHRLRRRPLHDRQRRRPRRPRRGQRHHRRGRHRLRQQPLRRHRRQRRAHRAAAHAHPRRHASCSSSTPAARSTARTATASA